MSVPTQTEYKRRQVLFAELIAKHIMWLLAKGYSVTVSDFYATSGHMENSAHGDRMAADLNIFINNIWMDGKDLEGKGCWQKSGWEMIGEHWKSLDPLCHWGGDFSKSDFNHFSITPDGKRC